MGSAGFDFFSAEEKTIAPGKIEMIKTGAAADFPRGVYLKIAGRSSLNRQRKFIIDGTVDSDFFPNEICILAYNGGEEEWKIARGERCAQGLFLPVYMDMEERNYASRNGGFGSTNWPSDYDPASNYDYD